MKKNILFITLILSNLLAFSQVPKDAVSFEDPNFGEYLKTRKTPTVKGKILNISSDEATKTLVMYSLVTFTGQNNKTANISSDGTFSLELESNLPYQQIWLTVGKDKFYAGIYAHTDLLIVIDWQKTTQKEMYMIADGVQYLGNDGELNTYLNTFVLFDQKAKNNFYKELSKLSFTSTKTMPYEKIIAKFDSLHILTKKIDSTFISQNPSNYAWLIENERLSNHYSQIIRVLKKSDPLWQKANNHKGYLVSNDNQAFYRALYYKITLNMKFDKSLYMNKEQQMKADSLWNTFVKTPLQDSITRKSNENIYFTFVNTLSRESQETGLMYQKRIPLLDSIYSSSKDKADFLKLFGINTRDVKIREKQEEIILASMNSGWIKDLLMAEHQKTIATVKKVDDILSTSSPKATTKNEVGEFLLETSFGAKLYEVKSGKGADLLKRLKDSFQEKALLLDFWFTSCGPCIVDLPYSKKVHDDNKDLPIEYIYLCSSAGSTMEKWKSKIMQLELSGTHIFVDENVENELMGMLGSVSFPSYHFIDVKRKYRAGAITRMEIMDREQLKKLLE
jgi:thiol-disulfide isomerase/thioredoxin